MKLLQITLQSLIFLRRMPFYAVARGREAGIYETWTKCEEQVKNFKGARYKKFPTLQEAEHFINSENGNCRYSGVKETGSETKASECKHSSKELPELEEFWPQNDELTCHNNIEDTELLSALAEVEGLESVTSNLPLPGQKRKASDSICSISAKILQHHSRELVSCGTTNIGPYEFQIDEEGFVIVYTDGSCINNGRSDAVAGFGVFFGDNHPLNASKPVNGRVTNNAGEIQASIHAIKIANELGIRKLCISTDSQFLINAVTSWMTAWKSKGWRLQNGEGVKNVVDFKILDTLLANDKLTVKWNYVKAHKGIKGNEMADKLAKEGAEIYRQMHLVK